MSQDEQNKSPDASEGQPTATAAMVRLVPGRAESARGGISPNAALPTEKTQASRRAERSRRT
jgi:hypothetical protein